MLHNTDAQTRHTCPNAQQNPQHRHEERDAHQGQRDHDQSQDQAPHGDLHVELDEELGVVELTVQPNDAR